MTRPFRSIAAVLLCGCAVLAFACASDPTKGYVWGSTFQDDIRTVRVPIFQNNTFTRGIEVELTDALIKEIQANTPWRVTTTGAADATLSGAVVDSKLRTLSIGRRTGLVQEQGVELKLQFELKDNRTGKVLAARRNYIGTDVFIPAQGLNERIEAGRHAAVAQLARDIVGELRSGW